MKNKFAFVALLVALTASTVSAQTTDTQTYTITVPVSVTLTAPAATVTLTHDTTDTNQAFDPQSWAVSSNAPDGVTVTFATTTGFQNTADATIEADAQLDLAVTGDANGVWTATTATAVTNIGAGNGAATVVANSTGIGGASLDLTVSFVTGTFSSLAAGDYSTVVTGTVTGI